MSSDGLGVLGPLAADRRQPREREPERRAVPRFERELDRLAHGELGEQDRVLERAAEAERGPLVRTLAVDLVAEELDGAAARHVPADRVEQRRLPRAVVADQPDHLARERAERHVVDRGEAAELDREAVRREHGAVGVQGHRVELRDVRERRPAVRSPSSRWTLVGGVSRPSAATSRARSSRSARSRPGCTGGSAATRCST